MIIDTSEPEAASSVWRNAADLLIRDGDEAFVSDLKAAAGGKVSMSGDEMRSGHRVAVQDVS